CQLSWIPADSKKIFTMEELVKQFSLSKLSKNSPVFDYDRLRFVNSRALQQKGAEELCSLLAEDKGDMEKKKALIELVKPRMKTLRDFKGKFDLYLNTKGELSYNNADLIKLNETYSNGEIKKHLKLFLAHLETIDAADFDKDIVESELRACAQENGLKAADLIHPARFALTSETVSPSIFDVFAFFGKEESIRRMNALINYLEAKK
ncbi:MAG: hypothetical protein GTO45_01495, partial [Candidatus Aminicenantes bacterium]|nr:hypothetical protein [Candidatus Aminicenantes bacterium]NIM77435.1 hypothetical protein [Candidatus Aminicenantes bacterium]NIN16740.1 hypothetical protein [Candidatus Aminicenantes bacterium]NIN40596.1 hypothetical protein [Candidatus Aminicenantes bacterium]NIN83417.1 hypothetical protein [Candidatus Aminicenantes bacterium]